MKRESACGPHLIVYDPIPFKEEGETVHLSLLRPFECGFRLFLSLSLWHLVVGFRRA
jgi:hypothetical protein